MMSVELKSRVESLSEGELQCLLLAAQHLGSKQIAAHLDLSPKTVDNRISRAMKRLGVADRDSAIRLLIDASHTPWGESLVGFSRLGVPPAGVAGTVSSRLPWPWPTAWRPENDHSFGMKLLMIFGIAAVFMTVAIAYVAAVILLSRLT